MSVYVSDKIYSAGIMAGLEYAKKTLGECCCYPGYKEHNMIDPNCPSCVFGRELDKAIARAQFPGVAVGESFYPVELNEYMPENVIGMIGCNE